MKSISQKAFFFDRDGTLTTAVYRYDLEHKQYLDGAALSLAELKLEPSAVEVINYVKSRGFLPLIITNQPDFLKSNISLRVYEDITTTICRALDLPRSQVFECLHKEGHSLSCECRKPKPGLINMAVGMHGIDLGNSWLVGDSWRDIAAGHAAGIKNTIFLERVAIPDQREGNKKDIQKLEDMGIKPLYNIKELN